NNRKSNYPTPEEEQSGKRFVDPCAEDPDDHFRLVRDSATGDYCQVAWLSPPAEYEVKKLQFNRRPFLRDFWRELNAAERSLISRHSHVLSLCSELDQINEDASWLLSECDHGLEENREQWPFPRDHSLDHSLSGDQ
ncbi:MAG: hypothetical protein O3A00_29445, partial [Planctomycetota bacterium]|nr:hypothetical protein [Planctomycetota bacterium]